MLTALLLSSLALAPAEAPAVVQAEPPVRVWLSKRGDVERGDRVHVYVETDADGYVMVLHVEPDGRVRVLFPLDPLEDNFVRGRTEYEIEGRGGREAFRVYEQAGVGTVYAAFSRDPFQVNPFVREDHWDYRIFETWRVTEDLDAEAELTALMQQMAAGQHFDYDLMPYYVGQRWADDRAVHHYYTGSPVYFGMHLRWGGWYPWSYRIHAYSASWVCSDPFWWDSWRCDPWYYGSWSYYNGWYDPWYDPWGYRWAHSYDPYWYYGYGYGYGYHYPYGYGYRTVYVSYPTRYAYANQRLVIGRYTFKPLNRSGFGDGGITARRRFAASAGGTQPVLAAGARRGVPEVISASPRRTTFAANAPAVSDGRRVVPTGTATNATARRTVGSGVAPAATGTRRVTPTAPADGRRVEPSGWGVTDGRRTVAPSQPAAQPKTDAGRRTPTQPTATGTPTTERRTPAQPSGSGSATRRTPTSSTATPARKPESGAQAVPTRRPTASTTPASASTQRRSTAVPRLPSTSSRSQPATRAPTTTSRQPVAVPRSSGGTRAPVSSPRPSTSSGSSRQPSSSPAPRPSTSSGSTRRPSSTPAPRPSASSGSSSRSSSPPARTGSSAGTSRTRRPE